MNLSKKILLVDWQSAGGSLLREALLCAGYTVRETSDASTLRFTRWFQPDLVVVNLGNTGRDGEALRRQLRTTSELRNAPLLCLSASRRSGEFVASGILSGYSFLAGPLRLDALLRGIARLFGNC